MSSVVKAGARLNELARGGGAMSKLSPASQDGRAPRGCQSGRRGAACVGSVSVRAPAPPLAARGFLDQVAAAGRVVLRRRVQDVLRLEVAVDDLYHH